MDHYVLTAFRPYYLSDPIAQEDSIESAINITIKSLALKKNITTPDAYEKLSQEVKEKFAYFGVKPEHVSQRRIYFAIPPSYFDDIEYSIKNHVEVFEKSLCKNLFLYNNEPDGPSIGERMELSDKIITQSVMDMYKNEAYQPNDMIHVTCSGYVSPSPLQKLVNAKSWFDTTVTHSYHMGCHGAIPAMRLAVGFLSFSQFTQPIPKKQVDIVHTELLTLHSCSTDLTAEGIISKTLFGDGFIRYSLKQESEMRAGNVGLKVLTLDETLLPNTLDDMSWKIKDHQFKITLGITIPADIQKNIMPFVEKLFKNIGLDFHNINREDYAFAIHPGGPKITSGIAKQLNLSEQEVRYGTDVLYNNGNMASATIPFILKNIVDDPAILPGKKIITMAFGPGLTAAGGIFEKVAY